MSIRSTVLLACLAAAGLNAAEGGKVHFHGYGEVHSNNDLDQDRVLDVHRAVIGVKAELAPNAFFNLEVDFEHAFKEPEMEFAYVDWVLSSSLTARFGHLLMPMGPLNEFHEPTLFLSVERPAFHSKFIPTTWNETGAGLALSYPEQGLAFRAYLVNGLNGSGKKPGEGLFAEKGAKGIRSSRYKGMDMRAEDVAGVGRLEYSPIPGLGLGASAYFGGADQKSHADSQLVLGLYEADVKYRIMGLQLQGQFGYGSIGGTFFDNTLKIDPRTLIGYLAEASYHFQDLAGAGSNLAPFARYEYVNLDRDPYSAPAAASAPDVGEQVLTFGVAYYPNPNLALKLDMENWSSENPNAYTAKSGKKGDTKTVINLGFGVMY